jgi:hypothetical protein
MDEYGSPSLVFVIHFQNNLVGPEFHVSDFFLFQIVIDRNPVSATDRLVKRKVFCAIKYSFNLGILKKGFIDGGFRVTKPEARKYLIGIIIGR